MENANSLGTSLTYLKFYHLKLLNKKKQLLSIKTGEGYIKTNKFKSVTNVTWQDVESCFQQRIRTGFISNHHVKDPLQFFFQQSFKCFMFRIKKEVKNSMLKVNVIFSANFIQPHSSETDIKTFSTKNNTLIKTQI